MYIYYRVHSRRIPHGLPWPEQSRLVWSQLMPVGKNVIAQSPVYGNVSNNRKQFDKRDLVKSIIITWSISVSFLFQ